MNQKYDVVVMGGGTVGTMVALDAALRGLRVALVEKGDLGRETNFASLGMFQGGLNYLHKDNDLVSIDAVDSGLMKNVVPHLFRRETFTIPVYPNSKFPLWLWDGYLQAYDSKAKAREVGLKHRKLSRDKVLNQEKGLRKDVSGAVQFEEWIVDPYELVQLFGKVIQNLGGTIFKDARVVASSFKAVGNQKVIDKIQVIGPWKVKDLSARYFVNAAGPWAPSLLSNVFAIPAFKTRLTKGTSIILNKAITRSTVILFKKEDHKYITVMPYSDGRTWVGPTNYDVSKAIAKNPDCLEADGHEIIELLSIIKEYFPQIRFSEDYMKEVRCGLRPQLFHPNVKPNDILHAYTLINHQERDGLNNLCTIFGGKLTNQARMAKETVDLVCKQLKKPKEWMLPNVKISEHGWPNYRSGNYYSAYKEKKSLSCDRNISLVAYWKKLKSVLYLIPFVVMGFLRRNRYDK